MTLMIELTDSASEEKIYVATDVVESIVPANQPDGSVYRRVRTISGKEHVVTENDSYIRSRLTSRYTPPAS